ncbi:hypothetical protein [Mesorhizobium sp.]|nr:hypothetical protein [Mesorhizobium sp.]
MDTHVASRRPDDLDLPRLGGRIGVGENVTHATPLLRPAAQL